MSAPIGTVLRACTALRTSVLEGDQVSRCETRGYWLSAGSFKVIQVFGERTKKTMHLHLGRRGINN